MDKSERIVNGVFKLLSWLICGCVIFMAVTVHHRYGFLACIAVVAAYFFGGLDYGMSNIGKDDGR